MERQKFKPCDAITAADAMELNSLVVIDVKPAILSNSKQRFRMQKPGRRGGVAQSERESQLSFNQEWAVSPPLTTKRPLTGCPALPP